MASIQQYMMMKKIKKYLLSDKQYSNIHQVNVLLSLTMKEKPDKCQLSLTMKDKPEKCQFRPFL